MNKALGRAMKCRPIWLRQMAAPVVSCSVKLGDRQSNNNMAPTNITSKCSACGKCKKSTPGIRLHLLPRDARRRHEWLLALGIAYERSSQVVCSDHFDAAYQGSKGRLLSTAIPRPFNASEEHPHRETHTVNTERPTAVSAPASDVVTLEYECPGTTTTHDSIDEAISSEVLPCDIYESNGIMSGQQLILHTPPVPEAPPAPVTPPQNVNAGHTSSPVPSIQDTSENLSGGKQTLAPRVQIYCIDGWLINLAALQALWSDLQEYEVKFLITRRLNQDCLENLFGKLRLRGGSNDHPTVYCFSKALRSVVNNDLLQVPVSGNCERDESLFLDVTSDCETDCPAPPLELESDSEDIFEDNLPVAEVNGLMYVVGWTCKKFLKFHDCSICREHLLDTKQDSDNINKFFCHLKAENNSESPFGGLSIPSATCLQHFKEVEYIVRNSIERAMLSTNVSKNLLSRLSNHTFITPLQLCSTQLVSTIYLIYIRLKIFSNIKWKNKEKVRKFSKKNRKVIKVMH